MTLTPESLGLPPKFTSFRSEVGQEDIILGLLTSTSRINVLQAPPGSGKTVIALSHVLSLSARCGYLTKTKSLQSQVHRDFASIGLVDIVGHSNYPCATVSYDETGELADLECESRANCFYRAKIEEVLSSRLGYSTNYAHHCNNYRTGNADHLKHIDVLICDEAHSIRHLLSDFASIKIYSPSYERVLRRQPPSSSASLSTWQSWAFEAAHFLLEMLNVAKDRDDKKETFKLDRLKSTLDRLISEPNDSWAVIPQRSGVHFKPVDVRSYVEPYLFRGVEKVLLISGTLFRDDIIQLGIDPSDFHYIEVSSAFAADRRQLIYFPTSPPVKVDARMGLGAKRLWHNQIDKILTYEAAGKGIIQSRSYARAEEIASRSAHTSSIIIYDKDNSREMIQRFKDSSPPCTIAGPTLEEGEDFPYSLCDYIIWPKVPFLPAHDPYIAAMKKLDKHYANREVCRSIIQGSLRGSRVWDDFVRIWMVDWHWTHFRNQPYFYPWFRDSFRQITSLAQVRARPP